jgi:hypothetical protein
MAFWGIALALGPCINNSDLDPAHEKASYQAEQKALSLASRATEREHDYIQALAKRYSGDPEVDLRKLDTEYAIAMRGLSKHYPDDLDAATLFAESLMDLHPWKLWRLDGRPTEGDGLRHRGARVEFPSEQIAVVAPELLRILPANLEMHERRPMVAPFLLGILHGSFGSFG